MRYRVAAAAVLAAVAVLCALGALDALGWRDAVPDEELPSARLPDDPVGRALELEDDVAFRRAVRAFRAAENARSGFDPDTGFDFDNGERHARARAIAAGALGGVATDGEARLASRAHDLLGVLAVGAGPGSPFAIRTGPGLPLFGPAEAALASFRAAIAADGSNTAAKENLELLLRRGVARGVRPAPGGGPGSRGGRGAGASPPGFGY